jgi:FKBP-type peptidyl-prolyl cis-trans isomerase 2
LYPDDECYDRWKQIVEKEISMTCVKTGSTVTISYIGTLDNGRIFDSTEELGPLTVTVGTGQLFPALELALIGMLGGETKNIVLSADEAYGPHLRENIITVARDLFPVGKEIIVGQKLSIEFSGGVSRVMQVTVVDESGVTLDGNHPLAGQDLTFALRMDQVS